MVLQDRQVVKIVKLFSTIFAMKNAKANKTGVIIEGNLIPNNLFQ